MTRKLLACGIVAGPLFLTATLAHAAVRDGFDLRRHPISLLALGGPGWVQVGAFVLAGALQLACAVGLARALRDAPPAPGAVWGPRLVGGFGAGLVVAGVFVTDAGAGFPAGAPAGAPQLSWHGALHTAGAVLSFGAMTAACLVFARRYAALGRRGWAAALVAAAVAVLVVNGWPDPDGLSVRLVVATAIQFAVVAALAADARRGARAGTQDRPARARSARSAVTARAGDPGAGGGPG
jgi:hypothetical protein